MTSEITLLFVLFWGMFICFPKKSMLIISFSATLLFVFIQLEIIADTMVLWLYLFMYAVMLMRLVVENKE